MTIRDNIFNPYEFLRAYSGLPELMMMQGKTAANMASLYDMGTRMMNFWTAPADNKSALSGREQQVFTKMTEQARLFSLFGEQILRFIEGVDNSKSSASSKGKGQYKQLEDYFDQLKTVFSQQRANMTTAIQQLLNTMQLFFAKDAVKDVAAPDLFMLYQLPQQLFNQHLSMPAIGCMREPQERLLTGARLLDAYFKALDSFSRAYGAVEIEVLDHLKNRLIGLTRQGKTISSLKQLYTIWAETHQKTYVKFISSEEYSRLYGNLINSLMRYRKHHQQYIDSLLVTMNIPGYDSINTTIRQQQQSRRSLQAMQQEFEESQVRIEGLEQQIETLKEALKHLGAIKEKMTTGTKRPARTNRKRPPRTTATAKS